MAPFHLKSFTKTKKYRTYRHHISALVSRYHVSIARLFIVAASLHALTGCATLTMPPGMGEYTLIAVGSTQDDYQFMKYSQKSGQAWGLGEKWIPVEDAETLPESHYLIKMVDLPGSNFVAVRLDMNSGRSWSVENRKWVKIGIKDSAKPNSD